MNTTIDLNAEPALRALLADPALAFPPCTGITADSRTVRPGFIFAALQGTRDDGRRHIPAARKAGAAAILGAPGEGIDLPVADPRLALALAAAAIEGHPSRRLRVFAITGTNGKTTTAWLLRDMLAQGGLQPGLITTVETSWPGHTHPSTHTTPDAPTLQALLRTMHAAGCRAAVIEASSHALDQQRTAATQFAATAFTNLTQDHLDYHPDMEAYYLAKKRLFTNNPAAPAILNLDDPAGRRLHNELTFAAQRTVTYAIDAPADLTARIHALTATGADITLTFPNDRPWHIRTPLAGRYNISNILCAAALAHTAGIPPDAITAALAEATPRWGRLQPIPTPPAAPHTFIDYAHTDDALRNALRALRELTPGKLWCVFGCGGDRDTTKRPKMGLAAAQGADTLIITSDNPRSEDPRAIIAQILAGIPEGTPLNVIPDRAEAIAYALAHAEPEDIVLIAGKGHETTQEIAGAKHPFNDAAAVQAFYRNPAHAAP